MVMPRARSSGSRSASMPVRARRSAVLPWSMCPAVPMTTVGSGSGPPATVRRLQGDANLPREPRVVLRFDRAEIEQDDVLDDATDDRRRALTETRQEALRGGTLDRHGPGRQGLGRQRPAVDLPGGDVVRMRL